jgi:hypothetical protein
MGNERGAAMVFTVVLILVMSALTVSIVIVVAADSNSIERNVHLTRALYIAEAGLERKIAQMNNQNNYSMEAAFGNGYYEVNVVDWSTDGVDNDLNGAVDDETENHYYTLTSFGFINERSRKIETIVKRIIGEMPETHGAIQLYNPIDPNTGEPVPGTLANFSGNIPPRVTGQDSNIPDGIPFIDMKDSDVVTGDGPGGTVLGVTTNDDQSVVDLIQELGRYPDRVDGLDLNLYGDDLEGYFENPPEDPAVGNSNIANISSFDPLTAIGVQQLADEFATYASAEYTYNATNYPTGESGITMGTLDWPVVTLIETGPNEEVVLNGDVTGAGILVVDGNVRFGGTFNYAGLILITSQGTARVEARGTPLIFGTIIAASQTQLQGNATVLDLRGTADVFYSTEGLSKAMDALTNSANVTPLMYKEISKKRLTGGEAYEAQ